MSPLSLKDYQEDCQERGIYDKRNPLNDMTGKEWLFSTKTIIPKAYPILHSDDPISKNIDAIPVHLSQELVETFSKPGSTILDPLAGIGSTLIGSHFSNKKPNSSKRICIGIEENQSLIKIYNSLVKKLNILNQSMEVGNPLDVLQKNKNNTFDFILTDIPIWGDSDIQKGNSIAMIPQKYQKEPKKILSEWTSNICSILSVAATKLKSAKYLVIAISNGNLSKTTAKETLPSINFLLSSLLTHNLEKIGLVLKSERIWFIPGLNNNNKIFNFIQRRFFVFRKEKTIDFNHEVDLDFFGNKIPVGSTKIIHKAFPPSFNHKLRSKHGGMKPPELAQILIEKYSNDVEDVILDPFAGVGGSLLGASLTNRRAIGIDINEKWREIYLEVSRQAHLPPQEFLIGDSRYLINSSIPDNSIDMVLTDVPYWAMDKLKKTRGRYSRAGEESKGKLPSPLSQFDQGAVLTIEEWLLLMKNVFSSCYFKLNNDRYLIVFIGNMYRTIKEEIADKKTKIGKYLMLSSLLAKVLLEIGYSFENEIVWYSPDKALHVFGYPFSYIPSVVHQSILVFKK